MKGYNLALIGLFIIFICFLTPAFAAELSQGNDMSMGDHAAIDANVPIDIPTDGDISIDDKTPADIPADEGAAIDEDVPIDDGMPIDDNTPIDVDPDDDIHPDGKFIIIVDNETDDSDIDYQNSDSIDPTFIINDTVDIDKSVNERDNVDEIANVESDDEVQRIGNIIDNIKIDSFNPDSSINADSINGVSSIAVDFSFNETLDDANDVEDDVTSPLDLAADNSLNGFNVECVRNFSGIAGEEDDKVIFKENNKVIFEPSKNLDLKDLSLSTIDEGNKKEDVSSLKIGTIKTYDGLLSVGLNHAIFVYSVADVESYGNKVIDTDKGLINNTIPLSFHGENKLEEYAKTGIVTAKEF